MTPIDANRESLAISRVAQLYAAILALHRARIFRPDRALIPARLGEIKPASAGEREDIGGDFATEIDHPLPHFLQPRMIKHHQHAARLDRRAPIGAGKPTCD